jgi:hypothetical protein
MPDARFQDSQLFGSMTDLIYAFRQSLKDPRFAAVAVLTLALSLGNVDCRAAEKHSPGAAKAATKRPATFPHRIWAACDFEGQTPDYGWFGQPETNTVPAYPGNRTALRATTRPYGSVSAVMTGINPVPGPRMGKENGLFVRYFLKGGPRTTFQHFSLTREDNWHIVVDGLTQGRWDEVMLNFTRDARRNDGSAEPFREGDRMDDFKLFAGLPEEASNYDVFIDDVIFFANDPALAPEPEPFPNRVILLAAFDTGAKEKYWPGDFEIAENPPAGALWRAAKGVPHRDGGRPFIRIANAPPKPVGAHTKLRYRYHLTGASAITVQIFDATVQDNRHIRLERLKQGEWATQYLDFRDSQRNDGTQGSGFTAGNLVDDLFFFIEGDIRQSATLFVDEIVLFDAGRNE